VTVLKDLVVRSSRMYGPASLVVGKRHHLLGNVRLAQGKLKLGIKQLKRAERIFVVELGCVSCVEHWSLTSGALALGQWRTGP
jgi:hypothetical protein